MLPHRIEAALRGVEALKKVTVTPKSPGLTTPYCVVRGEVWLHGRPYVFEVDISLEEIRSTYDCFGLAASILASFEAAGKKAQTQTVL